MPDSHKLATSLEGDLNVPFKGSGGFKGSLQKKNLKGENFPPQVGFEPRTSKTVCSPLDYGDPSIF